MMFKGILPKRVPPPEFTMVTPTELTAGGEKENEPKAHTGKSRSRRAVSVTKVSDVPMEDVNTNVAFAKLLDDLQIPSTLRPKLAGMDAGVKAAMLRSSQVMTVKPPANALPSSPSLRMSFSSDSLVSPKSSLDLGSSTPRLLGQRDKLAGPLDAVPFRKFHMRGASIGTHPSSFPGLASTQAAKERNKGTTKDYSPAKLYQAMSSTSSIALEIETVKKLRLLLRNESASWSQEFLRLGGYSVLLTRLTEILEVEWREEQHDDQILHELLRCFKALSTSAIGCFALRSSCPAPLAQLMSLLYSDKKPGDVATRQLIVELLLILFELYPSSSSLPSVHSHGSVANESPTPSTSNALTIQLPYPHATLFSLLRALLLTPAPPPTESPGTPISPHAFIESLHKPRIYKTYLREMSEVCRDYFWVFCHPGNTIWALTEVDESKVEKPRAPGGMTGGVEFEAMTYMTMHLKLLNAIAAASEELDLPQANELSAYRFHTDMFLSGIERIILVARKASTTYYPTLHLELARYVAAAARANFSLPWAVLRMVGLPPEGLRKVDRAEPNRLLHGTRETPQAKTAVSASRHVQRSAPSKQGARGGIPTLPSPKKVEPIRMD